MAINPLLAPLGRVLLFGGYTAALALWLFSYVGHFFLSRSTEDTLSAWGFYPTPVLFLGILLYAVIPPRRKKVWAAGIALVVGILVLNFTWPLKAYSDRLYVQRHKAALDGLVAEIIAYERIRSMDYDYLPAVNGTFVLLPGQSAASAPHLRRVALATALARDSIDPAKFADFQHRLAELHFMAFWTDRGEVTIARSRGDGLLYRSSGTPLERGTPLGNNGRVVRVLAKNWYYAVW